MALDEILPTDADIRQIPGGEEVWRLVDAVLDGRAAPDERERLETLATESPRVARLYLRMVHHWYGVKLHVQPVPAAEEIIGPLPTMPFEVGTVSGQGVIARIGWRRLSLAAALMLATTVAAWMAWPVSYPATVTANARAIVNQEPLNKAGTQLQQGKSFDVSAGALELTFRSGARVTVASPSTVRMLGDNTLALESGSMTAHVPPPAKGFRVVAPGLAVVDRGTSFGVRADANTKTSELAVFEGIVDATALNRSGQETSKALRLTAGQAVRHSATAPGGQLVVIAGGGEGYTRDIAAARVPLELHSTGVNVAAGGADPHWQVISVPGDPQWQPKAAYAASPAPSVIPKQVSEQPWVSYAPVLNSALNGDYHYRTNVDLTGYEASSVSITAEVTADDQLAEIRVNGVPCAIPPEYKTGPRAYRLDLSAGTSAAKWRAGANQVDVIVRNVPSPRVRNPTFLSLAWSGTAKPIVQR